MNTNLIFTLPYVSYPYTATNPYHLNTLATLFGMTPPLVETARILELGCAAGNNLIPHAVNYPKAHCVEVDLSKVQIDEANACKKTLGLKNIEFHHCSITDIDESFGKFDYIICHGVFSWVPKFVRDKIFTVSSKNLTENGIVYLSYNTLPGWNMIRSIRDMMCYHSSTFTNPQDKITQARLLLEFVKDSLENSNAPYAEMLKIETNLLATNIDSYLYHEHLEEENTQFYFYEFMEEASKNNLQYLADCNISSMYLGNMPAKVVEKLQVVNDIIRTEQYMDFITNRRFRSTLLCNSNIKLNRSLNANEITKFNMTLNVVPEKPLADIDLNSLESINFYFNGKKDSSLSTSSPYMKAIFYTFAENINNYISFEKITALANKKLHDNKLNEIKTELLNNAMQLVFKGYINITSQSNRAAVKLDRPQTSKLVLYQVANTPNMWVTNLQHQVIGINLFEKFALRYMNGILDKNQIIDAVMQHAILGEMTLNKNDKKIEDIDEIRKELELLFEPTLAKFATNALLM